MLWFKKKTVLADPPGEEEVEVEGGPFRQLHVVQEVVVEPVVTNPPLSFNDELTALHQEKYAEITKRRNEFLVILKEKIKGEVTAGANRGNIHLHQLFPQEGRGLARDDSLCEFLAEALKKEGLIARGLGHDSTSWVEWQLSYKGSKGNRRKER